MSKSKKLRRLVKQAKMGKPHAIYQLGICYQLGRCFPCDMNKAADLITAAAEREYAPAVEWLKDYYFDDDAYIQANV
ncbi:MAG: hypothetical protein E7667_06025 [Ruminococcaceae bacterium]|nr:hypothetical protein [Oscillospiraceae bacterium]